MRVLSAAATAAGMLLAAAGANAATIVYTVDQSIGSVGAVTGTITTDGATGVLGAGDIVAWDLTVMGDGASVVLQDTNSGVFVQGDDLSATAGALTFNFSGEGDSFLLFEESFGNGQHYWCNAANAGTCFQGASAIPVAFNDPTAQVEARSGDQIIATAGGVPEPAAWGLMIAGFAVLGAALRPRRIVAAA
jgi:hypothetical protein